ncbi:sigma-70 family RNA polymerase sigma factor [candidate division KSB1 bacterium]|nr:sigma-70 family RNA polymerase sigma factor [candidate division KSB1 bacterium]
MERAEDIELVERFQGGDERAFNEIVNRYKKKIYFLTLRMVNNPQDAEDLSQEVFIRAYKGLAKFQRESALFTWLYRIAVNHCINFNRKKRWTRFFSLEELKVEKGSSEQNPEEIMAAGEIMEEIKRTVARLPQKQRIVFILRQYENMHHKEIAAILGRNVGTVKANYFQAVHRLRRELKSKI